MTLNAPRSIPFLQLITSEIGTRFVLLEPRCGRAVERLLLKGSQWPRITDEENKANGRGPTTYCRWQRSNIRRKDMAKKKRKYSKASGTEVENEMRRYKKGTAKSGRGGKGGKVKSRKQAIAIGLSKARKKGKKIPKKRM
jgi:hypothetical protein